MMNFLLEIAFGIKAIPKKYQSLFLRLQQLQALQKTQEGFVLKENFVIGSIAITRSKLAFLCDIAKKKQDYKIQRLPQRYCKGDIVIAKITKKRLQLLEVLQSHNLLLCYLDLYKGKIVAFRLYEENPQPFELPLSQKSLRGLPRFCVICFDMRAKNIVEILGVLQDPKIDEKILLYHYNQEFTFSSASNFYAKAFGDGVDKNLYPNRVDLTHLPFYTIDPIDAKDYDDALYFDSKNNVLYVAIADVSEYVALDSIVDVEARKRGFSIYFPHICYPMLPKHLSENLCSLKESQERLAFVFAITLDDTNRVCQSHLFEAIICNHQNLSYEMVDLLLQNKKNDIKEAIASNIKSFYKIAMKLKEERLQKGYDFQSNEIVLNLDSNQTLIDTQCRKETKSHSIVEEAMLLANKQAARMLEKISRGIYRVHQSIAYEKRQKLFFDLRSLGFEIKSLAFHHQILDIQSQAKDKGIATEVDEIIIKAQNKALYSTNKEEHFGLGFESYTHFTSPIRRYSDLMLHRILKEMLKDSKQLGFLQSKIPAVCAFLNEQEKKIAKIEMSFKDRKFAHWASKNKGMRLEARVVDTQYPMLALSVSKIQGARMVIAQCHEDLMYFEKIQVEILQADLRNARIYAKYLKSV